jgi:hypothetical protein
LAYQARSNSVLSAEDNVAEFEEHVQEQDVSSYRSGLSAIPEVDQVNAFPHVFTPKNQPVRLSNRTYGSESIASSQDTPRPSPGPDNGPQPGQAVSSPAPTVATQYPQLSQLATPENWATDYQAAYDNQPQGRSHTWKRTAAHATLINGTVYGVQAVNPCDACLALNKSCRIYHEDIHTSDWRKQNNQDVGYKCSNCRTSTATRQHGECTAE